MSSLSPYPIPSSLHPMNNPHHHHPHHHNYVNDGTNIHYSVPHQLSENNVNVNSESSSNSSCLVQSSAIGDYYGQNSYHQTSSRTLPLYSHQNPQLYQENPNHLYRYNVLPSSSPSTSR